MIFWRKVGCTEGEVIKDPDKDVSGSRVGGHRKSTAHVLLHLFLFSVARHGGQQAGYSAPAVWLRLSS